jgi:hypothetical protein
MKDIQRLMSKREKMENVLLGNRKLQQKNQLYLLRRLYLLHQGPKLWPSLKNSGLLYVGPNPL